MQAKLTSQVRSSSRALKATRTATTRMAPVKAAAGQPGEFKGEERRRESVVGESSPCTVLQKMRNNRSIPPHVTLRPPAATRRATDEDKMKLIDGVDCFIFDCDGEFFLAMRVALRAPSAVVCVAAASLRLPLQFVCP